jgi:hypothetical protein
LAPRPFSPPVVLFLAQSSTGSFFFSCCSVFKAAMGNLFLRLGTLIENFQGRKRR